MAKKSVLEAVVQQFIDKVLVKEYQFKKTWIPMSDQQGLFSANPYNGMNQMFTSFVAAMEGYESRRWVTFNQIRKNEAKLKPEQSGVPVILWKLQHGSKKEKDESGKEVKKAFSFMKPVRYWNVFNIDQLEDLGKLEVPDENAGFEHDPMTIEAFQSLVKAYTSDVGVTVAHGGDRAYYSPSKDHLQMPKPEQFKTPEDYYAVVLHEATHATGRKNCLNRPGIVDFKPSPSPQYAKEELIAELSSVLMANQTGVETDLENQAAYFQSWMKRATKMDNPHKVIQQATTESFKVVEHLMQYA